MTGGESLQEFEKIKSDPIELFKKGRFKLQKWHSNEPNLETNDLSTKKELNFAKEHLRTKMNETKILDLNWDKQRDTFRVEILKESQVGEMVQWSEHQNRDTKINYYQRNHKKYRNTPF